MIKFFHSSCLIVCLVLFSERGFSQNMQLNSPDGKVKVNFKTGNQLASLVQYQLSFLGEPVVQNGSIAFEIKGDGSTFTCVAKQLTKVNSSWQTVYGERKTIPEKYNQLLLRFKETRDTSINLTVTLRAYNEGFAFQYSLRQKNKTIVLSKENSQFNLPVNGTAWVSTMAQSLLAAKKINDIKEPVERPLTIKLYDHLFISLGEAALVDFARTKFTGNGKNGLTTVLYEAVTKQDVLTSPWRYVMVAISPAGLLQKNYFVLNLNEPNRIKDTKWIKPGKVLREATLTTTGAYNCIDFAASHNIKYICFDAGWYGKEDSDTSDATRVSLDPARSKGPLDLKEVIRYGNSKNVGVLLYVNRRALERQIDTLLPLYESWGIKGLKFGFVQVGSQQWTTWMHEAVRKAAKYHMLVDIHDEYRPTGYSRTYPNLLTQEGIRGDEESPFLEHTITTLFTRMIAGAADNTNCYFTSRVNKMGSHTAQMAKAVCLYSPLQFLYWYDQPKKDTVKTYREGVIQEVPELDWYNTLPTVWDDTKILEGDMEAYATIARKSNNSWFVGSINGTTPRTVKLPLTFLDKNKKYVAKIYTDDPAMQTSTNVKITTRKVDSRTVLTLPVTARNAFTLHIVPQ